MTEYEKSVIETLPRKYRPIGTLNYFLYSILFAIPVVGFIFSLILSFRKIVNVNIKYYARLWLVINFVAIVFTGIFVAGVILLTDVSILDIITKLLGYIK